MASHRRIFALSFASVLTLSAPAFAHVIWVSPQPRHPGQNDIKAGPCGIANDKRDPKRVTVFEPGATITVQFSETIQHPGFFRISFDADGQDAFDPPPLARTAIETTPVLPVLVDNIADKTTAAYSQQVTLPNMECENCTLQLIQVMTTSQTWKADDIYYSCADIALRTGGATGTGGMSGGAGAGAAAGGAGAGGRGGNGGRGGATAMGASGQVSTGAAGMTTTGAGGTTSTGVAGMTTTGAGGTTSTNGTGGTGGTTGGGGAPSAGSGTTPNDMTPPAFELPPEEAGGCSTAPRSSGAGALLLLTAALAATLRKRRRASR